MSLQIWLPLNGNFNNQGLQNSVITNTSVTFHSSGKVGQCGYFNGSSYLTLPSPIITGETTEFTICCWAKFNSLSQTETLFTSRATVGSGISLFKLNSNNFRFDCGTQWEINNYIIPTNEWIHICVTKNTSQRCLYINGTLISSTTNAGTVTSISATASIGESNKPTGGTPSNLMNGYMNDFRFYNNCLSQKEIKIISQGLILHYPMGSIDGKIAGRNLLTGTNRRESNPYIFKSPSTDGCNSIISGTGIISVEPGTTYAIQCKTDGTWTDTHSGSSHIPADKDCSLWIYLRKKGTSASETSYDSPIFLGRNASYKYSSQGNTGLATWIWTAPSDAYTIRIRSNTYSNGTNEITVKMWDLKVEKCSTNQPTPWTPAPEDAPQFYDNIVYDTSGYMNNGTVTDSTAPSWSNDSPRYSGSYSFDGKNIRHINTVSLNTTGFKNTWTISWWSKTSDMNDRMAWGLNTNNLNFYPVGGVFYLNTGDGTSNPFQKDGVSVTYASYLGAWHHYVVTGDGTQNLLYIDGKNVGKAMAYKPITGNTLRIGTWPYDTGHLWNGNISDFRIYATALSSSDIESLYKTSASVTKNGTLLLAGEVIE